MSTSLNKETGNGFTQSLTSFLDLETAPGVTCMLADGVQMTLSACGWRVDGMFVDTPLGLKS